MSTGLSTSSLRLLNETNRDGVKGDALQMASIMARVSPFDKSSFASLQPRGVTAIRHLPASRSRAARSAAWRPASSLSNHSITSSKELMKVKAFLNAFSKLWLPFGSEQTGHLQLCASITERASNSPSVITSFLPADGQRF